MSQCIPVKTDQWISSWRDRLGEVIQHVQPWTRNAGGMPSQIRDLPTILELVDLMDHRVSRLSQIIEERSVHLANSSVVACIDRELSELVAFARTLDEALRRFSNKAAGALTSGVSTNTREKLHG